VADLLGARFAGFRRGCPARVETPPAVASRLELIDRPLEQVHFVLGGRGLPQDASERYVLSLLNTVVGGSMSSRLFQEIRERRGLVYAIHSGNVAFRDSGLFYVYAGSDRQQFGRVVELTLAELRKIRTHGVTADELQRAKDHLEGSLMLSLESTSSRMTRIAKQELYFGQYFTLDEILSSIDGVSPAQIDALIDRLLGQNPLSLVALGPAGADTAVPQSLAL